MKTLHKLGTVLALVTLLVGLNSCEKPENDNAQKGKVEISFNLNDPTGILKSAQIDSADSKSKIAHLLVSIVNSEGGFVMQDEIIPLYEFGNSYMTGKIEMKPGKYSLTKFLVINDNNKVIFAAPLEGSPRAHLVTKPLPLAFAIHPNEVSRIIPEVLPIGNSQPSDFGYVNFGFQIVKPLQFFACATIDNPMLMRPSTMTDALLIVRTSEGWSHEFKLGAHVNKLVIPAGAEVYFFHVVKKGYETQKYEFKEKELKASSESNPIIFKLSWGQTSNYLKIQPGPKDGKDAMITDLNRDKNFGNYPFFEALYKSEPIMTVMRTTQSLIHFNLNDIPKSARLDSVFLYLSFEQPYFDSLINMVGYKPAPRQNLVLQQIVEPWDEGKVTWENQPKTIDMNQVEIPFLPQLSTHQIRINVSRLYIQYLKSDDPTSKMPQMPNYGMMLKMPEFKTWTGMRFASSDNKNERLRPVLEVYYSL